MQARESTCDPKPQNRGERMSSRGSPFEWMRSCDLNCGTWRVMAGRERRECRACARGEMRRRRKNKARGAAGAQKRRDRFEKEVTIGTNPLGERERGQRLARRERERR
eukprot:6182652-Pleurochrysis_carterae.AAC.2